MNAKTETQKSARNTKANSKASQGFTDEEKAAMKERAKELKGRSTREQEQGRRGECRSRGDRCHAGTGSQHGGPAA